MYEIIDDGPYWRVVANPDVGDVKVFSYDEGYNIAFGLTRPTVGQPEHKVAFVPVS